MSTDKLPFRLDLSDELSIWRAETFVSKEPETLHWLSNFAVKQNPLLLLDIGANIGLYSLFYLSLNSNTQAKCCEPFLKIIYCLKKT